MKNANDKKLKNKSEVLLAIREGLVEVRNAEKKYEEFQSLSVFLNKTENIIESHILTLTPDQRFEINESKKDIGNGSYIDQFDLNREIEQWAKRE